jgi:hypothetical protein
MFSYPRINPFFSGTSLTSMDFAIKVKYFFCQLPIIIIYPSSSKVYARKTKSRGVIKKAGALYV